MILVSPFISIRAAARHIGGRLVAFLFSNVFQNQRRPGSRGPPGDPRAPPGDPRAPPGDPSRGGCKGVFLGVEKIGKWPESR